MLRLDHRAQKLAVVDSFAPLVTVQSVENGLDLVLLDLVFGHVPVSGERAEERGWASVCVWVRGNAV